MKVYAVIHEGNDRGYLVDVYDTKDHAQDFLTFLYKEYQNTLLGMKYSIEVSEAKTQYEMSFYHIRECEVMQ